MWKKRQGAGGVAGCGIEGKVWKTGRLWMRRKVQEKMQSAAEERIRKRQGYKRGGMNKKKRHGVDEEAGFGRKDRVWKRKQGLR
jgi:hypothetical protein